MRLGTVVPHYQYSLGAGVPVRFEFVVGQGAAVEEGGWDSLWVSDHLWLDLSRYDGEATRYDAFECLTTLGYLARTTTRVRLGTLVLCVQLRPPALAAKALTGIDVTSGGRLEVGLGAGWFAEEFAAAGVEFLPPRGRLAQLDEAAAIIGGMLEGPSGPSERGGQGPSGPSERGGQGPGASPFTFAGEHYHVTEAWKVPPPLQRPRPPLWIGGKGDRLIEIAARRADGWTTGWRHSPATYAPRRDVARAACERLGRDPDTLRLSLGLSALVGRTDAEVRENFRRMQERLPPGLTGAEDLETYSRDRLAGTVAEVVDTIGRYGALGVEEVICSFGQVPFSVWSPESFEVFTSDVLPRLPRS